jgi:hypothetical protein
VNDSDVLRYPIGPFVRPAAPLTADERVACIDAIEAAPATFRDLVAGMSAAELNSRYRPEGWTVRQVIHHVPDSHMNAYIRMRLAVTEDVPTIKPYDERSWGELADIGTTPISVSLDLLDALHRRWVSFLRTMRDTDFARRLVHPENGMLTLDQLLFEYAWHGRHHAGHVRLVKQATATPPSAGGHD